MNCDILKEVFQGTLSEADADDVLDGILDSGQASSAETLLGLSRTAVDRNCDVAQLWLANRM